MSQLAIQGDSSEFARSATLHCTQLISPCHLNSFLASFYLSSFLSAFLPFLLSFSILTLLLFLSCFVSLSFCSFNIFTWGPVIATTLHYNSHPFLLLTTYSPLLLLLSRVQAVVLALRADRARYMHLTFIRYLHTHTHTHTHRDVHVHVHMYIHADTYIITHAQTHICKQSAPMLSHTTHRLTSKSKGSNTSSHSHIQKLTHSNIQTFKHTIREGDGYAEAFFSRYLMEDR